MSTTSRKHWKNLGEHEGLHSFRDPPECPTTGYCTSFQCTSNTLNLKYRSPQYRVHIYAASSIS